MSSEPLDDPLSRQAFTCACSSKRFERVTVERPLGHFIVTDFIACTRCGVMRFYPLTGSATWTRPPPPPPVPYKGPLIIGRDGPPLIQAKPMSAEETQRHAEAVKAANKGKHKGYR